MMNFVPVRTCGKCKQWIGFWPRSKPERSARAVASTLPIHQKFVKDHPCRDVQSTAPPPKQKWSAVNSDIGRCRRCPDPGRDLPRIAKIYTSKLWKRIVCCLVDSCHEKADPIVVERATAAVAASWVRTNRRRRRRRTNRRHRSPPI
jgi:hypothetical protein